VSAPTCAAAGFVSDSDLCGTDLFAMTYRHPLRGVLGGALCANHRDFFEPGVLQWIADTPLSPSSADQQDSSPNQSVDGGETS
jgi:hypothetical protein